MHCRHDRADNQPGLAIWKTGLAMAREIFALTDGFPIDDPFGLSLQVRRAVGDVTSALADGQTRPAGRDTPDYMNRANRFLCDLTVQLIMCSELEYLDEATLEDLLERIAALRLELYDQMRSAGQWTACPVERPGSLAAAAAAASLDGEQETP